MGQSQLSEPQAQSRSRGPSPVVWYLGSWAHWPRQSQHVVWPCRGASFYVLYAKRGCGLSLGCVGLHVRSIPKALSRDSWCSLLSAHYVLPTSTLGLWLRCGDLTLAAV